MQMRIQTTVVEINQVKENKIPGIQKVTLQWMDIKKIQLTVTKPNNVDL